MDGPAVQVEQAEVGHERAHAGAVAVAGEVAQEGGVLKFFDARLQLLDLRGVDGLFLPQVGEVGAGLVELLPLDAERLVGDFGDGADVGPAAAREVGPHRRQRHQPQDGEALDRLAPRPRPLEHVDLHPAQGAPEGPDDRRHRAHGHAPPSAILRARDPAPAASAVPRDTGRGGRSDGSPRGVARCIARPSRGPVAWGVGVRRPRGPLRAPHGWMAA